MPALTHTPMRWKACASNWRHSASRLAEALREPLVLFVHPRDSRGRFKLPRRKRPSCWTVTERLVHLWQLVHTNDAISHAQRIWRRSLRSTITSNELSSVVPLAAHGGMLERGVTVRPAKRQGTSHHARRPGRPRGRPHGPDGSDEPFHYFFTVLGRKTAESMTWQVGFPRNEL